MNEIFNRLWSGTKALGSWTYNGIKGLGRRLNGRASQDYNNDYGSDDYGSSDWNDYRSENNDRGSWYQRYKWRRNRDYNDANGQDNSISCSQPIQPPSNQQNVVVIEAQPAPAVVNSAPIAASVVTPVPAVTPIVVKSAEDSKASVAVPVPVEIKPASNDNSSSTKA